MMIVRLMMVLVLMMVGGGVKVMLEAVTGVGYHMWAVVAAGAAVAGCGQLLMMEMMMLWMKAVMMKTAAAQLPAIV
jgi:hypothetical protein